MDFKRRWVGLAAPRVSVGIIKMWVEQLGLQGVKWGSDINIVHTYKKYK